MPNNKVIDISHHNQGNLNFAAAKAAGVLGVISKATQGSGYRDPTYNERKAAALDAGMLWGAYHFGTAADVDAQVSNFLGKVHPDANTLCALDFEKNEATPTNSLTVAKARQFVQKLDQALGRPIVIYGGRFMKDLLGGQNDAVLGQHRLWYAQYGDAPQIPPTWSQFWLWQFTDGHHGPLPHNVAGIGACDVDHFAGSDEQLREQWR
jgi:lysozyme